MIKLQEVKAPNTHDLLQVSSKRCDSSGEEKKRGVWAEVINFNLNKERGIGRT